MLAVVIGLVLVLLVSVGIVLLVALPHLRSGSRILSHQGERTVRQAQQRTTRTISGITPSRIAPSRIAPSRIAPSRSKDPRPPAEAGPAPAIFRAAAAAEAAGPERVQTVFPGQRPSPADSGPIPESDLEHRPEAPETRPVDVVDLRDPTTSHTPHP